MLIPPSGAAQAAGYTKRKPENACSAYLERKLDQLRNEAEERLMKIRTAPWTLGPEGELRMRAIFEGDPPRTSRQEREKFQQLFDLLLEERIQASPLATRWMLRNAADDVFKQKSIYSNSLGALLEKVGGPHYNPVFNRVVVPRVAAEERSVRDLVIAIHELEHAAERNANPEWMLGLWARAREMFMVLPTPYTPMSRFKSEAQAIGAQWEFTSRIPLQIRTKLIRDLEVVEEYGGGGPDHVFFEIVLESLKNAHLPKEEFIRKLQRVHGYTFEGMFADHYSKRMGRIVGALASVSYLYSMAQDPSKDPNGIMSADVRTGVRLMSYLMLSDEDYQAMWNRPRPMPSASPSASASPAP